VEYAVAIIFIVVVISTVGVLVTFCMHPYLIAISFGYDERTQLWWLIVAAGAAEAIAEVRDGSSRTSREITTQQQTFTQTFKHVHSGVLNMRMNNSL